MLRTDEGGRSPFPIRRKPCFKPAFVSIRVPALATSPTPGPAGGIKRLPITSIWDLFRADRGGGIGYSALNVRLKSMEALEPVKKEVKAMGFGTFAMVDQFREIRRSFLVMAGVPRLVAYLVVDTFCLTRVLNWFNTTIAYRDVLPMFTYVIETERRFWKPSIPVRTTRSCTQSRNLHRLRET